jgi:hypothetical protein
VKAKTLSANETLKALEEAVTGIRSFADREVGLDKARQLRDSRQRQSLAEEKTTLEKECSSEISHLREKAEADGRQVSQVLADRKVRVDKAQIRVRNEVVEQIKAVVGGRRSALQHDFMQAGKTRSARLEEIEAEFQERNTKSIAIQNAAVKLEKSVVKSLSGYQQFRKTLIAGLKEARRGEARGISIPRRFLLNTGNWLRGCLLFASRRWRVGSVLFRWESKSWAFLRSDVRCLLSHGRSADRQFLSFSVWSEE